MLGRAKRHLPPDELPPDKRWRQCMQDLTAANEVSAQDLQYLINCGQAAGAHGCNDLVRHIFFTKVDSCLLLRRRLCSTDYAGNVRWTTVKAN